MSWLSLFPRRRASKKNQPSALCLRRYVRVLLATRRSSPAHASLGRQVHSLCASMMRAAVVYLVFMSFLSLLPRAASRKRDFRSPLHPLLKGLSYDSRQPQVWAIPQRARPGSPEGSHSMLDTSERETENFNWLNAKFLDSLSLGDPGVKCAIFQRLGRIRASIAGSRNLSKGALHEKN